MVRRSTTGIDHGGLSVFSSSQEVTPLHLLKVTLVFTRPVDSPGSTRDAEMTSFYVAKTNPFASDTFDSGDLDHVRSAVSTMWSGLGHLFSADLQLLEVRYFMAGPAFDHASPLLRLDHFGAASGSSGHSLPPQVASTLTFITASRKHWGRMYWPAPGADQMAANGPSAGRFLLTFIQEMTAAFATLGGTLASNGLVPVVYSRTGGAALTITALEMDDVPDVQRRRRFATVGQRSVVTS